MYTTYGISFNAYMLPTLILNGYNEQREKGKKERENNTRVIIKIFFISTNELTNHVSLIYEALCNRALNQSKHVLSAYEVGSMLLYLPPSPIIN